MVCLTTQPIVGSLVTTREMIVGVVMGIFVAEISTTIGALEKACKNMFFYIFGFSVLGTSKALFNQLPLTAFYYGFMNILMYLTVFFGVFQSVFQLIRRTVCAKVNQIVTKPKNKLK